MKAFFIKYVTPKNAIFFLIGLLTALFVFRKDIKENKFTKAKLEMMERMTDTPVKEWKVEFEAIIDSFEIHRLDSFPID